MHFILFCEVTLYISDYKWYSCLSTRHQIWLGEFGLTGSGHTEDLKTLRAACPASCLPLMGRCKVHARGCHWLAASAAYESGRSASGASKRKWAPQTTRDIPKRVQKASINETELHTKRTCRTINTSIFPVPFWLWPASDFIEFYNFISETPVFITYLFVEIHGTFHLYHILIPKRLMPQNVSCYMLLYATWDTY